MLRGEPATSPSLHCIRGWDDYWWPDSALSTRAARSAALSTLTTLARTKPPPDRPRACLLRLQLRQLPRSEGSSCRFCLCGNNDWGSQLCVVRHGPLGLAASAGDQACPVQSAAVLASISIEVWRWRSGTLQTVVKRLFPFGGYVRPGNPGVDARSVGLSAVAPTPISPFPHACKRPELARRHESRNKSSRSGVARL